MRNIGVGDVAKPLINRKLGTIGCRGRSENLGVKSAPALSTYAVLVRHREAGLMRTIGIDLALTCAHKAVVADAQGCYLTPVFSV